MHACVTLLLDDSVDHRPSIPVVDLPTDPADDVRIWFQDDEGNQIVLVGCRPCLAHQFATLAGVLDGTASAGTAVPASPNGSLRHPAAPHRGVDG
jgi:hypothetical protein